MKPIILILSLMISVATFAQSPSSDLNTLHDQKVNFAEELQQKYSGRYNLLPSKSCTLNKQVKTIDLNVVPNGSDTAVRIKLLDSIDNLLETKFYSLRNARLKSLNSPATIKKTPNSLLWESADVKVNADVKKVERMTFSKDVVSFDVDRIKNPDGFLDTIFNKHELIGRSRCNFTKVKSTKVLTPLGADPSETMPSVR